MNLKCLVHICIAIYQRKDEKECQKYKQTLNCISYSMTVGFSSSFFKKKLPTLNYNVLLGHAFRVERFGTGKIDGKCRAKQCVENIVYIFYLLTFQYKQFIWNSMLKLVTCIDFSFSIKYNKSFLVCLDHYRNFDISFRFDFHFVLSWMNVLKIVFEHHRDNSFGLLDFCQ